MQMFSMLNKSTISKAFLKWKVILEFLDLLVEIAEQAQPSPLHGLTHARWLG